MFRTFMICIALMAAVVAAVAGADEPAATTNGEHRQTAAAEASSTRTDAKQNVRTPEHDARKPQKAQTDKEASPDDARSTGDVKMSGMSILGNEDAPKSLVIVPWKSAEIGNMPGLSMLLDDSLRPVDKDVFMRELAYYQVRAGAK